MKYDLENWQVITSLCLISGRPQLHFIWGYYNLISEKEYVKNGSKNKVGPRVVEIYDRILCTSNPTQTT